MHERVILLGERIARMRQTEGERAVIGQQQETLSVAVQAPHWVEAPRAQLVGQQIEHRGAALGIACRRHWAGRLVQQHRGVLWRDAHRPAIDTDIVGVRIHAGAKLADDLAIDRHAPRVHQRLGVPP